MALLLFQFEHRFFDEMESEVVSRCAMDGCHRLDLCGASRNPNLAAVELADARSLWASRDIVLAGVGYRSPCSHRKVFLIELFPAPFDFSPFQPCQQQQLRYQSTTP